MNSLPHIVLSEKGLQIAEKKWSGPFHVEELIDVLGRDFTIFEDKNEWRDDQWLGWLALGIAAKVNSDPANSEMRCLVTQMHFRLVPWEKSQFLDRTMNALQAPLSIGNELVHSEVEPKKLISNTSHIWDWEPDIIWYYVGSKLDEQRDRNQEDTMSRQDRLSSPDWEPGSYRAPPDIKDASGHLFPDYNLNRINFECDAVRYADGNQKVIGIRRVDYFFKRKSPELDYVCGRHWIMCFLPWTWLDFLFTKVVLSNTRLGIDYGFLQRRRRDFATRQIAELDIHQTLLGRLLGYGTIEIGNLRINYLTQINLIRAKVDEFRKRYGIL